MEVDILVSENLSCMIEIRDITMDDIVDVYQFIVREQGEAMFGNVKGYIEALIKNDELRIDGKLSWPKHEERMSRPPNTDFLKWIVDSKGYHFGKIALLNNNVIGVLLC